MMGIHFIRPLWFYALIAWVLVVGLHFFKKQSLKAQYQAFCDAHLLPFILNQGHYKKVKFEYIYIYLSLLALIFALTGPAFKKAPEPTFKNTYPRVVVLNLSQDMLKKDIRPSRLSRAKFILQDILSLLNSNTGLIVFSQEPFIAAPLTEDSNTLLHLIDSLSIQIMPIDGHDLTKALNSAHKLITDAGFSDGEILVIDSTAPSKIAVETAAMLSHNGINVSVLPIVSQKENIQAFKQLANNGRGQLLTLNASKESLKQWSQAQNRELTQKMKQQFPTWKDEGPVFILLAMLFLLPYFQRGRLS